MIKALFGPTTAPQVLRKGLDATMATHKEIARKIADAMNRSNQASGDAAASGAAAADDLPGDMAALADTQIRYETEARLLQLVYQSIRKSIHSNG